MKELKKPANGTKKQTFEIKKVEIVKVEGSDKAEEKEIVFSAVIEAPTFEQMIHALSLIGKCEIGDRFAAGKCMFDFCCIECDEEIQNDNNLMASLCSKLTAEYVLPVMYEVEKKNNSIDS